MCVCVCVCVCVYLCTCVHVCMTWENRIDTFQYIIMKLNWCILLLRLQRCARGRTHTCISFLTTDSQVCQNHQSQVQTAGGLAWKALQEIQTETQHKRDSPTPTRWRWNRRSTYLRGNPKAMEYFYAGFKGHGHRQQSLKRAWNGVRWCGIHSTGEAKCKRSPRDWTGGSQLRSRRRRICPTTAWGRGWRWASEGTALHEHQTNRDGKTTGCKTDKEVLTETPSPPPPPSSSSPQPSWPSPQEQEGWRWQWSWT